MKFKTKTRFVESFWGGVESFWGGIPISPILNYSFWVRAGEVAVALCSKCMGFHQNASSPNIQPAQSPWLYIYIYISLVVQNYIFFASSPFFLPQHIIILHRNMVYGSICACLLIPFFSCVFCGNKKSDQPTATRRETGETASWHRSSTLRLLRAPAAA